MTLSARVSVGAFVSALLTYQGVHEMIASGSSASDRKIIRAGEDAAVDGGKLFLG